MRAVPFNSNVEQSRSLLYICSVNEDRRQRVETNLPQTSEMSAAVLPFLTRMLSPPRFLSGLLKEYGLTEEERNEVEGLVAMDADAGDGQRPTTFGGRAAAQLAFDPPPQVAVMQKRTYLRRDSNRGLVRMCRRMTGVRIPVRTERHF